MCSVEGENIYIAKTGKLERGWRQVRLSDVYSRAVWLHEGLLPLSPWEGGSFHDFISNHFLFDCGGLPAVGACWLGHVYGDLVGG